MILRLQFGSYIFISLNAMSNFYWRVFFSIAFSTSYCSVSWYGKSCYSTFPIDFPWSILKRNFKKCQAWSVGRNIRSWSFDKPEESSARTVNLKCIGNGGRLLQNTVKRASDGLSGRDNRNLSAGCALRRYVRCICVRFALYNIWYLGSRECCVLVAQSS